LRRARPVRVSAIGARLSAELEPGMYNYGCLQVAFADGSVGWYEAGWGPMMSETAFFVKDVIGPTGCVSIAGVKEGEAGTDDIEAHVAESRRQFGECVNLAWAQQLKNKDLPEGGSKAVCLITPAPGTDRTELLHGCVKATVDGLLDLLNPTGPGSAAALETAKIAKVRARLYHYDFSGPGDANSTSWWRRSLVGEYVPEVHK